MTPAQTASIRKRLDLLENEHPQGSMDFALMRMDPEHQPGEALMAEMTRLGLAENGKVKPDIHALIWLQTKATGKATGKTCPMMSHSPARRKWWRYGGKNRDDRH